MRIGFVINGIATEKAEYTTVRLALAAAQHGHETWMMGVDDFSHRGDGSVAAHARTAAKTTLTSEDEYLESIRDEEHGCEEIEITDLDVLMMRNDPADDMSERPWAVTSGVLFAQLSVAAGTLVVNDPSSLANAVNKTYFQHFPEAVRPRTLISRDPEDISTFVKELGIRRRPQATPGLRRHQRLLRLRRRVTQPEPDDRGGGSRRLHRRARVPPGCRPWRRSPVPHERDAPRRGRSPRRVPEGQRDQRPSLEHARRW